MHAVHNVLVTSMPGSFGHWLGQGGLRKRRGSVSSDRIRLAFEEGRDPECYGTKISQKVKLEARELTGGPNHTASNSLIPRHDRVFKQGWAILLAQASDRGGGSHDSNYVWSRAGNPSHLACLQSHCRMRDSLPFGSNPF